MTPTTVPVTGAAGDQGAAAVRHLRHADHTVRAFDTAAPDSPRAQYLAELGATYLQGDLSDQEAVDAAMHGVNAVFAVPVGPFGDELLKADLSTLLIESAERADVDTFVQTTVAGLERHLARSDYGTGVTLDAYAAARLLIEARLRTSVLRRWTVLRPVTLMENYLPPKARAMFPWLAEGRLDSVHSRVKPLVAAPTGGEFRSDLGNLTIIPAGRWPLAAGRRTARAAPEASTRTPTRSRPARRRTWTSPPWSGSAAPARTRAGSSGAQHGSVRCPGRGTG